MKRLEDMPQIASRQLGGLEATPVLLAKAKLAAAEAKPARRRPLWQPVLAGCAALMFCVGAVTAALWKQPEPKAQTKRAVVTETMMESFSAGDSADATEAPRLAADVPNDSVSMSAGGASGAKTLFAQGDGSGFPLVRVSGATYRLLTSPSGISGALKGDGLGDVSEFNVEPALGASDIVSNAVPVGTTVYEVSGMGGAMIAAEVNGATRVFQRVSYAGAAIIGSETLADTLCGADDVQSLVWSGVGEVTDPDAVRALMQTLLDDAEYAGTSMTGSGSMQIKLTNGLTMQLLVGSDAVSACGTWSCPEFFEAFHEAIGE